MHNGKENKMYSFVLKSICYMAIAIVSALAITIDWAIDIERGDDR